MSLEQALAANTAALQALTQALTANPIVAPELPVLSTVVAVPVPTAPVVSQDSSPLPTAAFAPPAATIPLPAAPAAPLTAPPAVSGERDSKGMPWDGRIHASTKAKVADGSWRYKRGCDESVITQVESEMRAAMTAPAVAPAPAGGVGTPWPFPAEPVVVAPPPPAPAPAAVAPPPVVAPAPVAPVAVPAPPVAGAGMTYEQLMAALPPKIVAGEITATSLQQACETFGIPSIAALSTRPDLVHAIAAMLGLG